MSTKNFLVKIYFLQESFDGVFEEAISYNDTLKIYLEAIQMLADSEKYKEMEEKIKKMKNKFKQVPEMWLRLAKIYYSSNKIEEARQLQSFAIKSVLDKKLRKLTC